jgi:tRNA 2-thiouridine synthesizing protein A
MDWELEIDCVGLLCPLPVLRARKALGGLKTGQILRVLASDAMAAIDLPHFCVETGHEFLASSPVSEGTAYLIKCK